MSLIVGVDRTAFARALAAVRGVIESRNTIPILSHVLMTVSADAVTLTGSDMDIMVSGAIPATAYGNGKRTTFPAAAVARLLSHAESDKISISDVGGDKTAFRWNDDGEDIEAKFPCLDPNDFPITKLGDDRIESKIPASTLAAALDKVQFAVSREETRYYLNGIYFCIADGRVRAVATDGHRLARYTFDAPIGFIEDAGGHSHPFILPRGACAWLAAQLPRGAERSAQRGDEAVKLEHDITSGLKVAASWAGRRMVAKLIDGTFPDYRRVIPSPRERPTIVERARLLRALRLAQAIGEGASPAVKLAFDNTRLLVSTVSAGDLGEMRAACRCTHYDSPLEIGFNSTYLIQALGKLTTDTVEMHFTDSAGPMLLRSPGDADYDITMMPMRV